MKTLGLGLLAILAGLVFVAAVRGEHLASRQVPPGESAPIAVDAGAAAERLAAAVRFPTISWGDVSRRDEVAFLGLERGLVEAFPRTHQALARQVVVSHSLLYTWRGARDDLPPVVLIAHLDVVAVEPGSEARWTHPPFAGVIADGSVWGRGTIDDKSGVLGLLEAVEGLLASGFSPARTVYLAFGHNEEGGGDESGARAIAQVLFARGVRDAWLMDEGGLIYDGVPGITRPVALVGVAEKRALNLELRAHAAGGHASMPPAETAVGMLARALDRLERHPMPARLDGAAREMFDALAPEMTWPLRLVFANLWLTRPLAIWRLGAKPETNAVIRTTMAPTMLEASPKENVLASTARAVINVRVLPGDTPERVEAHVRAVIRDDRIEIDRRGSGPESSRVSAIDTPEFAALARAIRSVYPQTLVAPYLSVAATDAREYASVASNAYRFLPIHQNGALESVHGTNEHVRVDAYANAIRIYATIITTLAGR